MSEEQLKLVIIGSGPAGLTAAIYAARGGLNPVVISGSAPGGQLMLTTDVDDFPGFPEGIQGSDLMSKMRAQASRFETRFIDEDVTAVNFQKQPFEVRTGTQTLYSKAVIVATGASAKWLGLKSEYRLIGRGVSACAVCDGPFFKGKEVVIVGGGDAAMREAQHLSKYASSVTIIHRRETLKAQEALQELVKAKNNVSFIFSSTVEEILGEEKVTGVRLKDVNTQNTEEHQTDGIFVAIGHNPMSKVFGGQIEVDEKGYIKKATSGFQMATSVEGVFVAGDVHDHHYRQAVTAAGMGCMAAMDAIKYLDTLEK